MDKIVKNDVIQFHFEDGILCSTYRQDVVIDAVKAELIISTRHEVSDYKKQYWLHDITNVKSFTKDGRDYADKNGQEYLHASAVIVNSHITKFIFNTFLQLKKPKIPFQVFIKRDPAITWLQDIKKQNELKGIF